MVTRWGMSERIGTISFSERENPSSGGEVSIYALPTIYEETAELIDDEVNRIVRTG